MSSGTSIPPGSDAPTDESSRLEFALVRCLAALSNRPAALITDIDGTISRIVPDPGQATVDPGIQDCLQSLSFMLDLVAVITARDEATARRMVGAEGLTYVGNYGLVPGAVVEGAGEIARVRTAIQPRLDELPCVTLEDKGVAFSLHYRNCPDPEAVRLALLDLVLPVATAANARIVEGKKVIELVPAALPDKRSAFIKLMDTAAIRGLVYLGDDLSDLRIFQEMALRRRQGPLVAVGVAVTDSETDPSVLDAADLSLGGVDEVGALLAGLAASLRKGGETNGG